MSAAAREKSPGPDESQDAQPIPSTLAKLAVPIDGLKPYGRNPRRGNVDVIAESLRVHGQFRPVVVRTGTNEILAGNHTVQAARQLGWARIAATFVDVDDDTAARIVLIDNRANDVAGYDEETLLALLSELADTEKALAGTGFDLAALEKLEGGDTDTADALKDTDDSYREQYGVIVICGNETEQQQVYEQLQEQGFECRVVTT